MDAGFAPFQFTLFALILVPVPHKGIGASVNTPVSDGSRQVTNDDICHAVANEHDRVAVHKVGYKLGGPSLGEIRLSEVGVGQHQCGYNRLYCRSLNAAVEVNDRIPVVQVRKRRACVEMEVIRAVCASEVVIIVRCDQMHAGRVTRDSKQGSVQPQRVWPWSRRK